MSYLSELGYSELVQGQFEKMAFSLVDPLADIGNLMATLEYVRVYIDDLLVITKGSLDDHLDKLKQVFI